jgi:phenylacetic acid degradation operon negative regulatory protein
VRPATDPIAALLADFSARQPVRAGSLIITVFGDAVLPRGGKVLLADLIALLEAFSLNEGQVRMALSRLVAEGWLESKRLGRKSLYRVSRIGWHRFEEATRRLYFGPPRNWRGDWHVALLPSGVERDELRKDLGWLGFGVLAPGVMLHPSPDAASLASVIRDRSSSERPLMIAGKSLPANSPLLRALVERCWDFAELSAAYQRFLSTFAPLHAALAQELTPSPLEALLARIILIHDYRRIVLRDPMLPDRLLPPEWIGREAFATARRIYRSLRAAADRCIDARLHDEAGPLPPPGAGYRRRFS